MEYSAKQLRLKIMDCIEGVIESIELGDYAYEAWHYLKENDEKDHQLMEFLSELSAEWGFQTATSIDPKFNKGFLRNVLARLERYMNIEPEEPKF